MRPLILPALAVFLLSCGSEPKPAATAEPARKAEVVKPLSEARRFPTANLVDTKVIDTQLLGKSFMPGGTVAHYKKGKVEYDLFIARMPSDSDAALALPDWRKALTGAKLIPSFGGYFGDDGGRPVFVFSKGHWIAGVAGLSEKDADAPARILATAID